MITPLTMETVTGTIERALIAGDWHGDLMRALEVVEYAAKEGITAIVHVGDFGFWVPGLATTIYLDSVEYACSQAGINLFFVDGNHECFPALYSVPVNTTTGMRTVRPHLHHLPRGFRWTWNGLTWLALGGAFTMSRFERVEGVDWWPEECITHEDTRKAVAGGPVDVMISHDSPDYTSLLDVLTPVRGTDNTRFEVSGNQRRLVGSVVDATSPAIVFHGHHHREITTERALLNGSVTRVVGLAHEAHPPVLS